MTETIYFNGKKYNDISEIPASARKMVEKLIKFSKDENKDGVPDILQSGGFSGIKETFNLIKNIGQLSSEQEFHSGQFSLIRVSDTGIQINGKTYSSVDEMPDSIRNEYEKVVSESQDGRENIYDESWRILDRGKYFAPHDDENLNRQYPKTETPVEMVDSTVRFILIAAVALLIFASLAAAWVLLF
jgi:hypothetical protein